MDISEYEEKDVLSKTFESLGLRQEREEKGMGGCELAITDKARCIICSERIPLGTPRVWVEGKYGKSPPDEGIINIKRFICYSCSLDFLKKEKKMLKKSL